VRGLDNRSCFRRNVDRGILRKEGERGMMKAMRLGSSNKSIKAKMNAMQKWAAGPGILIGCERTLEEVERPVGEQRGQRGGACFQGNIQGDAMAFRRTVGHIREDHKQWSERVPTDNERKEAVAVEMKVAGFVEGLCMSSKGDDESRWRVVGEARRV
jgi:hypothetical protein